LDNEIEKKEKKFYKGFVKKTGQNFVKLTKRQNYLWVKMLIGKSRLEDPKKITIDKTRDSERETRRIHFKISSKGEIEYALELIEQAYNYNEEIIEKRRTHERAYSISEERIKWDEEPKFYKEIRKIYIEVLEKKLRGEISNIWDETVKLVKERTGREISDGQLRGLAHYKSKRFEKDEIHRISYWERNGGLEEFLKAKEEWKEKGWCE